MARVFRVWGWIMNDQYFRYLDELRESGVTNMLAAPTFLMTVFGLSREKAREVFLEWTRTVK